MVTRYTQPNQVKSGTHSEKKEGKVTTKGHRLQGGTQKRQNKNNWTRNKKHEQKYKQKIQTKDNHMIRVGQMKHPRQQATQERQSYKQRKTSQAGGQRQGYETNITYSVPRYNESCTSAFTEELRLKGVCCPSISCIVPAPPADSRDIGRIKTVDVISG